jgi:predicted aspartyl protease
MIPSDCRSRGPKDPDDPARRQFLTRGATSLAFASLLAHAQVPLPAASDVRQPASTADAPGSVAMSDGNATRRPAVDVRINGQGPYRFLIDTGADRSVVAAEVAAAIGLPARDAVTLRGVVRAVAAETVSIAELSCGPIRRGNLLLPTLSTALLGADGYLGLDLLDGHRVTFDFKGHTFQITESRGRLGEFWVAPNEARLRVTGRSGHLRAVNCLIDGVATAAFIDSGAEVSAGNTALMTALMKRDSRHQALSPIQLTDVTGGALSGNVTMIRSIKLNEVTFTDCPLVVADFEVFDVWGLRNRPAVLIGLNFLQQFSRVSIDYGLKEIRFDLASVRGPPMSVIDVA